MALDPITAGLDLVGKALDRFVADPAQRDAAKLAMFQAQLAGQNAEIQTAMSAIIAEANSADPWTSRARPSFLYVVYLLLLWGLPMGVLSAFRPDLSNAIATGFGAWLKAIPEPVLILFGTVMTGYSLGRSYEKGKGVA